MSRLPLIVDLVGGQELYEETSLPSTIAWLRGVVGESLHHLFELAVRLSPGKNLTHLGNVVIQEVQRVSNFQTADECEGSNFLPTVGDFGELVLEEVNV